MDADGIGYIFALVGAMTSFSAGLALAGWMLGHAARRAWIRLRTLYDLHTLERAARQIGKRLPWDGED